MHLIEFNFQSTFANVNANEKHLRKYNPFSLKTPHTHTNTHTYIYIYIYIYIHIIYILYIIYTYIYIIY